MSNEPARIPAEPVVLYQCPRDSAQDDGGLDLIGLTRLLWRRRRFIAIVSLLAGGLGLAVALMVPVYYTVEVVVKSADSGGNTMANAGGLAAAVGVNIAGRSSLRQLREMLLARQVAYEFLDQSGRIDTLRKGWWEYENNAFIRLPGGLRDFLAEGRPLTKWRAYEKLDGMVNVDIDDNGMTMRISLTMYDPELAAEWANSYLRAFNRHYRNVAVLEAEKSLEILSEEARRTGSLEIKQILYQLIEREMEKKVLAGARDEYALHVIDHAVPPERKSGPARSLFVLLGLVGGLMLSVFAVVIRDTLSTWKGTAPNEVATAGAP